jgi:hypothetical protein
MPFRLSLALLLMTTVSAAVPIAARCRSQFVPETQTSGRSVGGAMVVRAGGSGETRRLDSGPTRGDGHIAVCCIQEKR